MSIVVTTDVFCDGTDPDGTTCPEWTHGITRPGVDRPGARRSAAEAGWTHVKGRDFCPAHSAG